MRVPSTSLPQGETARRCGPEQIKSWYFESGFWSKLTRLAQGETPSDTCDEREHFHIKYDLATRADYQLSQQGHTRDAPKTEPLFEATFSASLRKSVDSQSWSMSFQTKHLIQTNPSYNKPKFLCLATFIEMIFGTGSGSVLLADSFYYYSYAGCACYCGKHRVQVGFRHITECLWCLGRGSAKLLQLAFCQQLCNVVWYHFFLDVGPPRSLLPGGPQRPWRAPDFNLLPVTLKQYLHIKLTGIEDLSGKANQCHVDALMWWTGCVCMPDSKWLITFPSEFPLDWKWKL